MTPWGWYSRLSDEDKSRWEKRNSAPAAVLTPGQRGFLSRPLGQEANPAPWNAWAPFMDWLREHYPDRFFAICAAEDAISDLERQGITGGPDYDAACQELYRRFEEARRLKLKESVKVWLQ